MAFASKLVDVLALPVGAPSRAGRRHTFVIAALTAALVAGVGILIDVHRRAPPRPPPLLVVAPVTRGLVAGTIRATGTLRPIETTTLTQPMAGQLVEVRARVGDRVGKGQLLARFDPLVLRADLARAESRVVTAEVAALEAEIELFRIGLRMGPPDALDPELLEDPDLAALAQIATARVARASAELAAQEAAFKLARRRVTEGVIRAPAAALVLARHVEQGQVLAAGAPTYLLAAEPLRFEVELAVPEHQAAQVAVGQPAEFGVPALPGRNFTGHVARILPLTGPETERRLPVRVAVAASATELRPGMTAAVRIRVSSDRGVARIPTAALLFAPRAMAPVEHEPAVWLVAGAAHELRRIPVHVGVMDGGFAEVHGEGLREGATVAVGYAAQP